MPLSPRREIPLRAVVSSRHKRDSNRPLLLCLHLSRTIRVTLSRLVSSRIPLRYPVLEVCTSSFLLPPPLSCSFSSFGLSLYVSRFLFSLDVYFVFSSVSSAALLLFLCFFFSQVEVERPFPTSLLVLALSSIQRPPLHMLKCDRGGGKKEDRE